MVIVHLFPGHIDTFFEKTLWKNGLALLNSVEPRLGREVGSGSSLSNTIQMER